MRSQESVDALIWEVPCHKCGRSFIPFLSPGHNRIIEVTPYDEPKDVTAKILTSTYLYICPQCTGRY